LSPPSSVLMTFELKGAASCIRHENKFSSRFWIWLFPFNFVHKFSIWVKNVFLNNFFGNERSVPRLQLHTIPRSSSLYFNTKEIISLKYKIISLGNNFFFSAKRNSRYIVLGDRWNCLWSFLCRIGLWHTTKVL
jgi:hypothetical protein